MDNNLLPIFSSDHSLGKSILTVWDAEDQIKNNSPISIFTIAKKYSLDEVFLCDCSFSGFIQSWEKSKNNKLILHFGYKVNVCDRMDTKDDDSTRTESKITIWVLNTEGYKDILKLHNRASNEGFYYHPRLDWAFLNGNITKNLLITIDFYDGFLARNLLNGHHCVPDFKEFNPIFEISEMGLPFDRIIKNKTLNYCKENTHQTMNTHHCYYYAKNDVMAYQTFCAIHNRSALSKPELSHFSQDTFCWEEYCNKANIAFSVTK